MAFRMPGFQTIDNFFVSVQFHNPAMAQMMHEDLVEVSLCAMSSSRTPAYPAVRRLRARADSLPVVFGRILDNGLQDMGYSLEDIYKEST